MAELRDVKEGDHLALSGFNAPEKLTVSRVLARYVETTDGRKWNRETGHRWGVSSNERSVVPWQQVHTAALERHEAGHLARMIEQRVRSHGFVVQLAAGALPHLREAAKALGMEVE
jgi:hypothetical protein